MSGERVVVAMAAVLVCFFASRVQASEAIVLCPAIEAVEGHQCASGDFLTSAKLEVFWDGGKITFQKKINIFVGRRNVKRGGLTGLAVDCVFESYRTNCLRIRKARASDEYGVGLKFVVPIAAIIPTSSPHENALRSEGRVEWDLAAKNMVALEPLAPKLYSSEDIDKATEVYQKIGSETEDTGYFDSRSVLGGPAAVDAWMSLAGRTPRKDECDDSAPCSVALHAKLGSFNAVAYCRIMKSKIGLGLPYSCDVPVIVSGGVTYLLSYSGPEQCGCGAGAGAFCEAVSEKSLDQVVALFVAEFESAKTNMSLITTRKTEVTVTLNGKHVGKASKFFKNYFEKAYAHYVVSLGKHHATGRRTVTIEGLYNLVISAQPSPYGVDYRDFGRPRGGESHVEWFQSQILEVLKAKVMRKIGADIHCKVIDID